MKVPNCTGNSFVGGGDSYEESSSDYDEVLEFSSEGEANDFSDFLWMENEVKMTLKSFWFMINRLIYRKNLTIKCSRPLRKKSLCKTVSKQ